MTTIIMRSADNSRGNISCSYVIHSLDTSKKKKNNNYAFIQEEEMITSDEIKRRLWDGATQLRGSMDASRYKDYMLGLMFYKFLSDKTLETFKTTAGLKQLTETELIEEYKKAQDELGDSLLEMIQKVLGYYVLPEYLYQSWLKDIAEGDFEVQKVIDSLNHFERTIATTDGGADFKGLFSSSTLDLNDTALGNNLNDRSRNIKALIQLFEDLNMVALQKGDVLGDAYEYLIGQFAMESGKKAGEFYTPRQVSEVMAQIVSKSNPISTVYDPTVGSGSLLLTVKKHLNLDMQKNLAYYGQEKNTATYNLTRMNLLLHGVRPEKMVIKNGDTLSFDWPEDPEKPNEGVQFDAVVMNPPYSVKNWNKDGLKVSDPRFDFVGTLPPDSKGDFAFLLHGLYHLGANGTMAIVLPHGVLFRGSSEGEIRKKLIEKNRIDTIIGLPNNLFTNTGIPVTILILKKNRQVGEPVLIIDASNDFVKVGKQNVLLEKDIAKIVDTYTGKKELRGYSKLASLEEIIENQYNLNIPRYVEAIDGELPHDVDGHLYGGIPDSNINELKALQSVVPSILKDSLEEVRKGYFKLTKSVDDISKEIFTNQDVLTISSDIAIQVNVYLKKYWDVLKQINNTSDIKQIMEDMLNEIKLLLSTYSDIDVYGGYQVIAEIWKNSLTHDTELISLQEFYTLGRTREPNLVMKGSGDKKREEQDGWVGALIPNELILKHIFSNDISMLERKKERIIDLESQITEQIEATTVEDSFESMVLGETLNAAADAIDMAKLKAELKKYKKNTEEHELLQKIEQWVQEKSELTKQIKVEEKDLKDKVYDRILTLSNTEIDQLMYEKWFGNVNVRITQLIEEPIKNDLKLLKVLSERYSSTLTELDSDSENLENDLRKMMDELVVTS